MSGYELYTLFLCLVVFILLTVLLTAILVYAIRLKLTMMRVGILAEKIKADYERERVKPYREGRFFTILANTVSVLLAAFLVFSIVLNYTETTVLEDVPMLKVVKSDSMSYKNKKNTYLFENGLDDQIGTYDLIVAEKVPDEFDLELYDVVLYEIDGIPILHRIVDISEPNEDHPGHRLFRLQGDAVPAPDFSPVTYDQRLAVYRGQSIPFIGSFVVFLQSPAGWLCVILMLFATIVTPIVDKKLETERLIRLHRMGCCDRLKR